MHFFFAYYPYICITLLLAGLAFRYVTDPGDWNARSSRPDPSRTGTPAPPATTLCKCMDSTQRKSAYGLLKNASRRMGPSPIPARRECFPTDGK